MYNDIKGRKVKYYVMEEDITICKRGSMNIDIVLVNRFVRIDFL